MSIWTTFTFRDKLTKEMMINRVGNQSDDLCVSLWYPEFRIATLLINSQSPPPHQYEIIYWRT